MLLIHPVSVDHSNQALFIDDSDNDDCGTALPMTDRCVRAVWCTVCKGQLV